MVDIDVRNVVLKFLIVVGDVLVYDEWRGVRFVPDRVPAPLKEACHFMGFIDPLAAWPDEVVEGAFAAWEGIFSLSKEVRPFVHWFHHGVAPEDLFYVFSYFGEPHVATTQVCFESCLKVGVA